ncbi:MAG: hypothetical protein NVS3B10_10810 [Polyangiales bacterium]
MNPNRTQRHSVFAMPHRAALVALAAAALLVPAVARAEGDAPVGAGPGAPARPLDFALDTQLHVGAYGGSNHGGMPLIGLALLARYGVIEGGVLHEGGSQLWGGSMVGTAGLVGVGFDPTPHLRLSLLGEAGRHAYDHVGGELFGQPGSSGEMAYAGGRAGFQFAYGRDVRFTLGAWLFVRDDLGRHTETVRYDDGFFTSHPQTATNTLGQWQTGAVLRLGVEWGV